METNWNQLIERYLQNELSEEGKMAFEQELQLNPELREELEMHQLVQDAAKRASQRMVVKQVGKTYLRNLRIKQFSFGVLITAAVVTGIVVFMKSSKQEAKTDQNQTAFLSEQTSSPDENQNKEESALNNTHTHDQTHTEKNAVEETTFALNDSLSPPASDHTLSADQSLTAGANNRKKASYRVKTMSSLQNSGELGAVSLSRSKVVSIDKQELAVKDSVQGLKPTVAVLGFTAEKLNSEMLENQLVSASGKRNIGWTQLYDSVGKFNDLYCGYALVMDKAKFGFVDRQGRVFIPLVYDQIVVTVNIKSSKQKNRSKKKKKVLYIPKRSGSEVKDCEDNMHPMLEPEEAADSLFLQKKK